MRTQAQRIFDKFGGAAVETLRTEVTESKTAVAQLREAAELKDAALADAEPDKAMRNLVANTRRTARHKKIAAGDGAISTIMNASPTSPK